MFLHMPVALAGLYTNKSLQTEHQHLWVDMVREGTGDKQRKWKGEGVEWDQAGRGLVPPTIERIREPSTSRSEPPEMGGTREWDTTSWNQGTHAHYHTMYKV